MTIKSILGAIKTNYGGPKIPSKLLIIESDDWGAVRMPNKTKLAELKQHQIEFDQSQYQFDCLESNSDLEDLFELLYKYKDMNGNHAAITANTIMANPDFERIITSNFKDYHYNTLEQTEQMYVASDKITKLYKIGNENGVFRPQFHGREHLNINRWLKSLQNNEAKTRICCEAGFTSSGQGDYAFMEAFDWNDITEVAQHQLILEDGFNLFEKLFNYQSTTFIPPCYTYDLKLEIYLKQKGVQVLQGIRNHLQPTGKFNQYNYTKRAFGKQPTSDLFYNVRNVFFEPAMLPEKDWLNEALWQIKIAFLLGKPAVITSHRINFVSGVSPKNKQNNLKLLNILLGSILKNWPDVKFITTDQLTHYLYPTYEKN